MGILAIIIVAAIIIGMVGQSKQWANEEVSPYQIEQRVIKMENVWKKSIRKLNALARKVGIDARAYRDVNLKGHWKGELTAPVFYLTATYSNGSKPDVCFTITEYGQIYSGAERISDIETPSDKNACDESCMNCQNLDCENRARFESIKCNRWS